MEGPEEKRNRKIFTVSRHISHHAAHSGYDLLGQHVGEPVAVPSLLSKLRGLGAAQRLARNLSGMKWYNGLSVELSTAIHMRRHKNCIYHFLFAENDFRYLPSWISASQHKIVCTFHTPPAEFPKVVEDAKHYMRLDAAIGVASNQKSMLEKLPGRAQVGIIPHGVDTKYFSPESGPKSKICLSVGHHHRDLDTFCAAAEILKKKDPDLKLLLVDRVFFTYRSKEDQQKYVDWFNNLGNVELKTDLPDDELLRLYRSCEVMLLPLLDTTANVAVLEALSCGLPLVVSDVGGIRDYVDESCAALVPSGGAQDLADQVLRILQDRDRAMEMSRAARAKALQYDWSVIAQKMMQFYQSL